ncbi:MAG: hypothetical protein ACLVC1_10835 [Mediterraneibacter gnavus]
MTDLPGWENIDISIDDLLMAEMQERKKETKLEKAQKLILELLGTKGKVMCLEELEAELQAYERFRLPNRKRCETRLGGVRLSYGHGVRAEEQSQLTIDS